MPSVLSSVLFVGMWFLLFMNFQMFFLPFTFLFVVKRFSFIPTFNISQNDQLIYPIQSFLDKENKEYEMNKTLKSTSQS